MLILFDKNVPDPLARFLPDHHVRTAARLGWDQLKNGVLLKTAEDASFEVMITADQNLEYQQTLTNRRIALIVLGAGNWPIVKSYLAEIVAAVKEGTPDSYVFIKMPLSPTPKYSPSGTN